MYFAFEALAVPLSLDPEFIRVQDKEKKGRNKMSTSLPTIPPDNPKRDLTLAQPDNPPHIGLVGDTYTITVTGELTDRRFCVIDMHIPPEGGRPRIGMTSRRPLSCSKARWKRPSVARSRSCALATR